MPKARLFNRPSLHLDYFRDNKNRINQVLTWSHPNDRKLCIVKYDLGDGYWTARDTGITYKRILSSYSFDGHQENLKLIKKQEPDYHFHSEVYGVDFLAVPNNRIKDYYYPEKRLQEIIEQSTEGKLELLEEKVLFLAEKIHDYLGIPLTNIGISGSIISCNLFSG
jgi:predicted nucleotidyltransferase